MNVDKPTPAQQGTIIKGSKELDGSMCDQRYQFKKDTQSTTT
jgi:hypothetical protein